MKKIFIFTILAMQVTFAQNTFRSEEVNYWNQADSVHIFGTLTMPENGSKLPAVILITGSGTQDRDETILGHKPFKVIAEYLSNNGIAVLRVDDRGAGKTTKGRNPKAITSENFAEDVKSGIDYLKTRSEINHKKIYKLMEPNFYMLNFQKILYVAGNLHKKGYENLRIVPSLSPSGLSWRCSFIENKDER